jgi:DNA-binding LytR/AlgR family response regulator
MNVLIVEDEPLAAENLESMILAIDPSIRVLASIGTVRDGVKWLQNNHPDLMFFDIRLSDGLSFEIFNQVEVNSPIVFTTAYNEYAIKVFEVNSIDFLLKPIKFDELKRAIRKYHQMQEHFANPDYRNIANIILRNATPYKQRFSARVGQRLKVINSSEIAYIHSYQGATHLYSSTVGTLPLDESLDRLESMLDPRLFFRVNRQFIVHISAIAEMNILSNRSIKVSLNPKPSEDCIVSVQRLKAFKDWLDSGEI